MTVYYVTFYFCQRSDFIVLVFNSKIKSQFLELAPSKLPSVYRSTWRRKKSKFLNTKIRQQRAEMHGVPPEDRRGANWELTGQD